MFIPLHVHTTKSSVGDSTLKIEEYVKKAKQMGLTHLAVTGHGSMADMYEFYSECIKNSIIPIIGCEVYEALDASEKSRDSYHLVLLAKNDIGLRNLLYIVTNAQLEGMYYNPRTDINILREHGEGIIALSACVGGKIPQAILDNKDEDDIVKMIEEYKEIFDDFYLEIQPGNFEAQQTVNQCMIALSELTNTELIVTNDIHYLNKEDAYSHDYHVKIHRKVDIEKNNDLIYPDSCYYLQSSFSIYLSLISSIPSSILTKAINNTITVANQCHVNLSSNVLHMPIFPVPDSYNEHTYLTKLAYEGFEKIEHTIVDPAEYTTRIEYELDTLRELGFSGYFLVVRDLIEHALSENIEIGPGRGSICGSLVANLIGITKVDPIKHSLLFERFISKHRVGSIPDIDIDVCGLRREELFRYIVNKYGINCCALVSTFGMRKAKASLRDIGKILKIDKELVDEAAKLIPQVYYDEEGDKQTDLDIQDSIEVVPRLREIAKENIEWFDLAMKLENLPRHTSIHAAGTIISPVDLTAYIPLIQSKSDYINSTSLTLDSAQEGGFVKQDLLSLATLSVKAEVERLTGIKFDYTNFDDNKVWELIGSKFTTTLFQIGSSTYRKRMFRLKPKTIDELAACLALVRGPCISAKADEDYMQILEGKKEIELIHPLYDCVTKNTNGILLYQEQIMFICNNFGFDMETSFKIMKAIAKKKIDKIREYEADFYEHAKDKNVSKEAADKIWTIILEAGLYCFNQSHAVAYAMVCYMSAWYKTYYPVEWMCASLTNAYIRTEEVPETLQECRRLGIKFLGVSVNNSDFKCSIENNSIRLGMCAIKGFGSVAAEETIKKRPITSIEDYLEKIEKKKCTKRALIPAIFSGLFDDFGNRVDMYNSFCDFRKETSVTEFKLQSKEIFNINDNPAKIEEILLGASILSNPVNSFKSIGFDNLKSKQKFNIKSVIKKIKTTKDKKGDKMAFITLETADGILDCIAFNREYVLYKKLIKKDLICTIEAKKDSADSCILLSVK